MVIRSLRGPGFPPKACGNDDWVAGEDISSYLCVVVLVLWLQDRRNGRGGFPRGGCENLFSDPHSFLVWLPQKQCLLQGIVMIHTVREGVTYLTFVLPLHRKFVQSKTL